MKNLLEKTAGFVGYGGVGGTRAVEHLQLIMGAIKVSAVRTQVAVPLFTDFENFSTFKPGPYQEAGATAMLDDLASWGGTLQTSERGHYDN
jgi:NAD(P)H-dependent FMN reductase